MDHVNQILCGDNLEISKSLPSRFVDVIVTSPPYWGQRSSHGVGDETDPREYLENQVVRFMEFHRLLKNDGIMWVNIGDAYNTPINWKFEDKKYSSLGGRSTLTDRNTAYTKKTKSPKSLY